VSGSPNAESPYRLREYTLSVTEPGGKFQLERPDFASDEDLEAEDQETLAAIDEGLKDSEAGRTVPAREVRKRLPKWITASSTRKGR